MDGWIGESIYMTKNSYSQLPTPYLQNRWLLHIQSTAMVTDVTAHIYPDSAGFHYCKLLSPAKALEWMYVDGLRLNYSAYK